MALTVLHRWVEHVAATLAFIVLVALLWLIALTVIERAAPAFATVYTVDSTGDAADDAPCNDVCATAGAVCTLRAALREANCGISLDTIEFNIPGAGQHTITVTGTALLSEYPIIINGLTEPGSSAGDILADTMPTLNIRIVDGNTLTAGLTIGAPGSTVKGLEISTFLDAFAVCLLANVDNVTIQANHFDNCDVPLSIDGATGTQVGGTAVGEGNWISNGGIDGIGVRNANGVTFEGNLVEDCDEDGIYLQDSELIMIGGVVPGARNIFVNNSTDGTQFSGINVGNGNSQIFIYGNYSGVEHNGDTANGNGGNGVKVATSTAVQIGGLLESQRNVLSSNDVYGVLVLAGATDTVITGNTIGRNAADSADRCNGTANISDAGTGTIITANILGCVPTPTPTNTSTPTNTPTPSPTATPAPEGCCPVSGSGFDNSDCVGPSNPLPCCDGPESGTCVEGEEVTCVDTQTSGGFFSIYSKPRCVTFLGFVPGGGTAGDFQVGSSCTGGNPKGVCPAPPTATPTVTPTPCAAGCCDCGASQNCQIPLGVATCGACPDATTTPTYRADCCCAGTCPMAGVPCGG